MRAKFLYTAFHSAAARTLQKTFRGFRARKGARRVLRHTMALVSPVGVFIPADTLEKWF